MPIFFIINGINADGVVNPNSEITLTDYIIKDINWLTSSLKHNLDDRLYRDFEYMVEVKGEILTDNTIPSTYSEKSLKSLVQKEEEEAKKLINWALSPEDSTDTYKGSVAKF